MPTTKPVVYQYLDYRLFLKDLIEYERSTIARMSLRAFTARVLPALSSSGLLSAVLKGKKNLGPNLRSELAQALPLKPRESQFFELLVQFNQAGDLAGKNRFFVQLSRYRRSKAKVVSEGQYLFFSRWYYPVIFNYFGMNEKQKNPMEIAMAIYPPLTSAQVEEAIRLLLKLGMIRKLANGYAVTDNHLATESEFQGLVAAQYNQQFLQLAMESLHHVDPKHRQFNTIVFSSSRDTIDLIMDRMTALKEEVQEILGKDPKSECIYTLGMHLFPNTKPPAQ